MKTVYLYDAVTGFTLGEWQAQESPLEEGVFITPVYSTDKEPPAEDKKIAKFDKEKWGLLPNLKGERYWLVDGTEQEITEAGISFPDNALLEKPKPAPLTYKELRAKAYPSLEEQADMAYWDRQNGTTTLDDAITAVKTKYPKG
jgi:hypothetical protein